MTNIKIPGAVWSGILVALALLPMWIGDSFPGAVWAAPVAGLLTIAAKVIEVMVVFSNSILSFLFGISQQ